MSTTYRFSVDEYERMIAGGVFDEDARIELLRGEVQTMVPPNPPHEDTIDRLMYWSVDATDRRQVRVRIQNTVGLPELDSVPEPDVAWMRARDYRTTRPQSGDVLLLIEVADSSLGKDRLIKAPLYAEAGVQEYWIVNLVDACVEVHRHPRDGTYSSVTSHAAEETISPLCNPNARLLIGQLFEHKS